MDCEVELARDKEQRIAAMRRYVDGLRHFAFVLASKVGIDARSESINEAASWLAEAEVELMREEAK